MSRFPLHTVEDAPGDAREILRTARGTFGFLPNILAGMATSPALLEAYTALSAIFEKTSLSVAERQIVMLTISRSNDCRYCVAAHTLVAGMQGLDADAIRRLRDGEPLADARLEVLRNTVTEMVEQRGWLDELQQQRFFRAGYKAAHLADIVLAIGMKTMSNYFNHIAGTELDEAFRPHAWHGK